MERDIEQRLTNLDDGQKEILRELADMKKTLRNAVVEIGGVPDADFREPDRRSLRWRLHTLENDRSTAQAARAAVDGAIALQQAASDRRFSKREKVAGLLLAAFLVVGPYLAPVFYPH